MRSRPTLEETARLLAFNEYEEGPSCRLLLRFQSSHAVILVNDLGLNLLAHFRKLLGHRFVSREVSPFPSPVLQLDGAELPLEVPPPATGKPAEILAWAVYWHNNLLTIATQNVSARDLDLETVLPPSIGIVITGRQAMLLSTVVDARVLNKDEPTPYIGDAYGDSYSGNFSTEPRIIDSVPETVFHAVKAIMASARRAYNCEDYETAAKKYQKAFHYCHKYYPEVLSPSDLEEATALKMKTLLNLAMAGVKEASPFWLATAIESCDFLLSMPEIDTRARAKSLFRRGLARLEQGDDVTASRDLESSFELVRDQATAAAIKRCVSAAETREKALRNRLRGAFPDA